jgi:hypothetical protein
MARTKNKGMDRRTFIKTSGIIGLGVATSSFGVPKLLRAAPPCTAGNRATCRNWRGSTTGEPAGS